MSKNSNTITNTIIIGSGPAGHTAAIYLSRANLHPLMLEGDASGAVVPGGLLTTTKTIENMPGFPDGVDGYELTQRFKDQSLKFGTHIITEAASKIIKVGDDKNTLFEVHTLDNIYLTKTVIISTGSTPNRLYIPGYDEYWHKGISTCAICDGSLKRFRNVPIAVVGGGDSACEEATHLSHTASNVYLIHRRDTLRASKIMADRVLKNPKITVIWNTQVIEALGDESGLTGVKLQNNDGTISTMSVNGLFVATGHKPNSQFVKDLVELDDNGYIKTNEKKETNVKGIWAAGDVQDPIYRQAITSCGDGCRAALEVERFLH